MSRLKKIKPEPVPMKLPRSLRVCSIMLLSLLALVVVLGLVVAIRSIL